MQSIRKLAALLGLGLAAGAGSPVIEPPKASPVIKRPTASKRTRIPGKPGRAGDKMARMAAEGRLGVRS